MSKKVSVIITTYNLAEYISQALDSVLNQKTNFDYSIIIADDASTDGTVEILKKYQQENPQKIELMLSDVNRGSLANSNRAFDGIDSEYFSFLDGDDYWIGTDRLQKQVDFLDTHKNYSMCGGNSVYVVAGKEDDLLVNPAYLNASYDFESMLQDAIPFIHTSSLLVRNTIFCEGLPEAYYDAVETFENCALRGEDFRRIIHLECGPMYVMNETLSAYRIHSRGIWQGSSETKRAIETAIGYNFYCKYFGAKYGDFFIKKRAQAIANMTSILNDGGNIASLNSNELFLLQSLLDDLEKSY